MKVSKKTKNRDLSFGTIALIEDKDGLRMQCDLVETIGVNQAIMSRIKAAIAGLAHTYEATPERIEAIGIAYMDGIESGRRMVVEPPDTDKGNPPPSMGFRAKIA